MTTDFIRQRVHAAFATLERAGQPAVWLHLADRADLLAEATTLEERVAAGATLPLAGMMVAVKDNIDVAGMPTTAASPGFSHVPTRDAEAVRRLREAGAVVLGKTNMDQFATGLVGTRSPYGAPHSVRGEHLVSGGSSSGSAVAVALGIVDAALGTDTAGSGRVPAAFNSLVGIKPTLGLVSTRGVLPAAPSYDAVTVFARELGSAERVLATLVAADPEDPASRSWEASAPLAAPESAVVGIPTEEALRPMSPEWRTGFETTVAALRDAGTECIEVDISGLLDAATLLYDGALVAERTAAFGELLSLGAETVDPSVEMIVTRGHGKSAIELVGDQQRLRAIKASLATTWARVDAMLLPTAPGHPTFDEVAADPIGVNSWVGTYTNFVNLLDLAAVAVPGADDVGVTLVGPAFTDRALLDLAHRLFPDDNAPVWTPPGTRVAVFGAHLSGMALNHQLTGRGARLLGAVTTTAEYALYALDTEPAKPGLVHVGADGHGIDGEEWLIPHAHLGAFLTDLQRPMTIGKVVLDDGREVLGFLCEPDALATARNITQFGGWRGYRDTAARV